jgi:hypothetical protein
MERMDTVSRESSKFTFTLARAWTPRFAGSDRKRLAVGRPEFDNIRSVGLRAVDCDLVLVGHGSLSITSCPANLRIAHRPSATPNPTAAAPRCSRRGKEASRIRLRSQRLGAGYISPTVRLLEIISEVRHDQLGHTFRALAGSPLVAPPLAETQIVRDSALQRANFSLEFRMGKHHLRKCDGMRPDVLCLGKIYIVRVHERLLPPPAFAECCHCVLGWACGCSHASYFVRLFGDPRFLHKRQLRLPLPQLLFTRQGEDLGGRDDPPTGAPTSPQAREPKAEPFRPQAHSFEAERVHREAGELRLSVPVIAAYRRCPVAVSPLRIAKSWG